MRHVLYAHSYRVGLLVVQVPRRRSTFFFLVGETSRPTAAAASALSCVCSFTHICARRKHPSGAQGPSKEEKQWHNKVAKGRAKAGSTTLLAFLLLRPPTLLFEAAKHRARTVPLPSSTAPPPVAVLGLSSAFLFLILFYFASKSTLHLKAKRFCVAAVAPIAEQPSSTLVQS